eukprot:389649_1
MHSRLLVDGYVNNKNVAINNNIAVVLVDLIWKYYETKFVWILKSEKLKKILNDDNNQYSHLTSDQFVFNNNGLYHTNNSNDKFVFVFRIFAHNNKDMNYKNIKFCWVLLNKPNNFKNIEIYYKSYCNELDEMNLHYLMEYDSQIVCQKEINKGKLCGTSSFEIPKQLKQLTFICDIKQCMEVSSLRRRYSYDDEYPLVAKSDDLSNTSRMFHKRAKKLKSRNCIIL